MGSLDHQLKAAKIIMMEQSDLFGNSISLSPGKNSVKVTKLRWSFSRLNTFGACPRMGYYQYFGGSKRKADVEFHKDRIQFLKQLSTGASVAGEVVHRVISAYFNNAKKDIVWTLPHLISFANKLLDDAFRHSTDIIAGAVREYEYRAPAIIQELFYQTVEIETLRTDLRDKMRLSLEQFCLCTEFAPLREGAVHPESLVEKKILLDYEGALIDGAIDLMYPEAGGWIIADWKTGQNDSEESSLQLLTYALWAHEHMEIPLQSMSLHKAFLQDGVLEPLLFSSQELKRAKARILQDIELLTEMEEFGAGGVVEAFTACNQVKVCAQCAFQEICTKE
jgi:hypothetical protein